MAYEIWAPLAGTVAMVLGGETVPLERTEDGWWAPSTDVGWVADTAYGYLIDDAPTPLPDPRSRRQPDGVHGLSRTFDPRAHSWRDSAWAGRELAGGVIYELHVGTFTSEGTLDSAIEKLDHLVKLGVDFVEVIPVNAFNGVHNWGYDGVLWYAVHEAYGGPAAYQRFVDACHERGLGVIQDVVYNHFGPSGNYLPTFGPYLDDASANTWGSTVNLAEPDVREYIIGNAVMWLDDYHVDGLRLDAVHALVDTSGTHILAQLAERVDLLSSSVGRPLSLIAESDLNDPMLITPRADGGYGLTAQWSDDYHHAAHVALTGETSGYYADFDSLDSLGKVMTHGFFHDGTFSSFREHNHGVAIDLDAIQTWRLVTFTQDHDQIGNRATGDRLAASLDDEQLAIAAVLTLVGPFTPMIFMGEEWGASTPWQFFTSHPEPSLGKATAEGRIAEFAKMGWDADSVPDPQDPATFERSKLDWSELDDPRHARLLALYSELIGLRRSIPGLTESRFAAIDAAWDDAARWLRLDRPGVAVAINFGSGEQVIPLPGVGEVVFSTRGAPSLRDGGILLSARTAAVIRVGRPPPAK